ncbi:MAG: F0F1 ATP synthase subunit B [Fusobacteria bacterium]|nr:F0F1 ATP synthase subunit B [Fusobacteriota bacterium]
MHAETLPLVSVDLTLFLQMINFAIMIILFRIFFYKPLKKVIEQRRRKISHDISMAESFKKEGVELQKKSEERLELAQLEAKEIISKAIKAAEMERERILLEARASREQLLKQTNSDIERTLDGIRESLAKESIKHSLKVAEKIISDNLDEETNRQLVDKFIRDLRLQSE